MRWRLEIKCPVRCAPIEKERSNPAGRTRRKAHDLIICLCHPADVDGTIAFRPDDLLSSD
jgi:hypothetical protein